MAVSGPLKRYYSSTAWHRLREATFKRDGYTCRKCGAIGKQAGGMATLNAAHRVSRAKGGTDSLDNLVTLCNVCHRVSDAAGHRADKPTRCPHGASRCRYCNFRAPDTGTTRAFG